MEDPKLNRLRRMPVPLSESDKRWLRDYNMAHMIPILEAQGVAAMAEQAQAPIAKIENESRGEPLLSTENVTEEAPEVESSEPKKDSSKGTDYAVMKLKELQAKAEQKGLPTYGKKAEIIERLMKDDKNPKE